MSAPATASAVAGVRSRSMMMTMTSSIADYLVQEMVDRSGESRILFEGRLEVFEKLLVLLALAHLLILLGGSEDNFETASVETSFGAGASKQLLDLSVRAQHDVIALLILVGELDGNRLQLEALLEESGEVVESGDGLGGEREHANLARSRVVELERVDGGHW